MGAGDGTGCTRTGSCFAGSPMTCWTSCGGVGIAMSNRLPIIPYAVERRAGGELLEVLPEHAKLGRPYFCPDCGTPAFFKPWNKATNPDGRVRHFAHKGQADAVASGCCFRHGGGETEVHKQACHAVKAALLRWVAGSTLLVALPCVRHGEHVLELPLPRPEPGSFTVLLNTRLADRNRRPDVRVAARDGTAMLCVEVFVSNKIREDRAEALRGVPCIEIPAGDVRVASEDPAANDAWHIRWHNLNAGLPACAIPGATVNTVTEPGQWAHGALPVSDRGETTPGASDAPAPPSTALPAAISGPTCADYDSIALFEADFETPHRVRSVLALCQETWRTSRQRRERTPSFALG